MQKLLPNRRRFLAGIALSGAALPGMSATSQRDDNFEYELVRTDDEWRAYLTEEAYAILRMGQTEVPHSSPYAAENRRGNYFCAGCDLHAYTYEWKVPLDKGWVFFSHAIPNSVLMDVDLNANYAMRPDTFVTAIEAHCRRCGSHLGHILTVDNILVHCINGAALNFNPATS